MTIPQSLKTKASQWSKTIAKTRSVNLIAAIIAEQMIQQLRRRASESVNAATARRKGVGAL